MANCLFALSLAGVYSSETYLSDETLKSRSNATSLEVRESASPPIQAQLDQSLAVSQFPLFMMMSSASSQQEEAPAFNANEARFFYQMFGDIQDLDEGLRTSPAAAACRAFVMESGRMLVHRPHTRCAVFPDENSSVTLIAHSDALSRQLSFEFHSDGSTLEIIKIDKHMQLITRSVTVRDLSAIRNAIAWLASS